MAVLFLSSLFYPGGDGCVATSRRFEQIWGVVGNNLRRTRRVSNDLVPLGSEGKEDQRPDDFGATTFTQEFKQDEKNQPPLIVVRSETNKNAGVTLRLNFSDAARPESETVGNRRGAEYPPPLSDFYKRRERRTAMNRDGWPIGRAVIGLVLVPKLRVWECPSSGKLRFAVGPWGWKVAHDKPPPAPQ